MSAECRCPQCHAVCEYTKDDSQQVTQCINCRHVFLAPREKRIPSAQKSDSPGVSFYHACFVDTWKVFVRPHNYILIGFIMALTVFKFFVTGALCADRMKTDILGYMYVAGLFLKILLWGWLAGIYFNIAQETAVGFDDLSDEVDDAFTAIATAFLSSIGRPILLFYFAVMGSLLPWLISIPILGFVTNSSEGLLFTVLASSLLAGGIFVFPAALANIAVSEDILTMRPDYILSPIIRAFCPYLLVLVATIAAAIYWVFIVDYEMVAGASNVKIAIALLQNILFQFAAIITMRIIGLYYRHYSNYFCC